MAKLRSLGVKLMVYIDNILLAAPSVAVANNHTNIALKLLQSLGFVINWNKSSLEPEQTLEYLGLNCGLQADETVSHQGEGLQDRQGNQTLPPPITADSERRNASDDVGNLASSTGSSPSLQSPPEFGQQSGDQKSPITESASTRLWQQEGPTMVDHQPSLGQWPASKSPSPDIVMETDASLKRWGAVMGSQRAGGPWMDSKVRGHIYLLELKAAGLALRSFVSNEKNTS